MIKVNNLNKYYNKNKNNEIHVINDVTLQLPDKGLISFLGESGSGKTTLLNVLGGLDKASGSMQYDDFSVKKYNMMKMDKFRSKNVGYIFQNYNILQEKTVYDNLKIALDISGINDKEESQKRIEYTLKAVGLYKFRKKLAGNLSGGQMQRVAIARALLKNNKIIIADEPTGNLDSANSIEIMNILKKISEKSLVLLVTHDKKLAEFYSDQIVEIKDGRIVDIRENINRTSLKNKNDFKLYLKDMNCTISSNEEIDAAIYSNGETPKFTFTLVENNGTYYIKSNVKIKLLEDSNLELVDDHYKDVSIDDVKEEIQYDTSWYDDSVKSSSFKRMMINLKDAFKSFWFAKKRTKFLRVAFVLIGIVIGFINATYVSYNNIDTSHLIKEDDVYGIDYERTGNYPDDIDLILEQAYNDGNISKLYSNGSEYLDFFTMKSSYINIYTSVSFHLFNVELIKQHELISGRMPAENIYEREIVIGKALANELMDLFDFKTYDEIYLLECRSDYKIVGISSKNSNVAYSLADYYQTGYYVLFSVGNMEELTKYFDSKDIVFDTIYDIEYRGLVRDKEINKLILFIVIIVLLVISLIYMYFTMRSRMISDIYNIGVMRSLGQSKLRLIGSYAADVFVLTLFTTLLGYVGTTIIYGGILEGINKIVPMATLFDAPSTYITVALIFGASMICGLIPILTLLTKTPAEINAKYDI